MTLDMIAAGVGVLILAVAWYGLQIVAIRDLRERPSVRGENKLLWAFVVLCVPYAGALGYLTFGPTSFRPRPGRPSPVGRVATSTRSSRPGTAASQKPAPVVPGSMTPLAGSAAPAERPIRPTTTGRPARRLAHDPVIGTDTADLLPTRISVARSRRPVPDAIRWPGTAIPHSYQPADAELHD